MRALLSAVGTRGDVQPIVALAHCVRELGHEVRLCVPPNFVSWVQGFGFEAVPVGISMRAAPDAPRLTAEALKRLRASMPDLIGDQFTALEHAAQDCDVMLGANAHQYAARSIAELHAIPYVNALYAPIAIPSPDHLPPPAPGQTWEPDDAAHNAQHWKLHLEAWNERALDRVNENRTRRGLAPIADVLTHNLTDRPWLATDEVLAPVPRTPGMQVSATGAWMLRDARPLDSALLRFLDAGTSPIYFGFGSMPTSSETSRALVDAARAVGRRAIISRGWAELASVDAPDCMTVDDVNHGALFARVCAIVHHGGAGTTAVAAHSGRPQLVVPMFSDQFYWASRVRALRIGSSIQRDFTAQSLASALQAVFEPEVGVSAQQVAKALVTDGAMVAAHQLTSLARG